MGNKGLCPGDDGNKRMQETSILLDVKEILQNAYEMKASDIHLCVGSLPVARVNGNLMPLVKYTKLSPEMTMSAIRQCLDENKQNILMTKGEADASLSVPGIARYRINAFKQRGTYSLAFRQQPFDIPQFDTLGLPPIIKRFAELKQGLVLVTGVTGSGKSTTLASIVDMINTRRKCHIITIEEPIEYLHRHKNCLVNQREVGLDSASFASALRSALREDPDVILVGEMRDLETISTALTAAETGHLVFSTLHTSGAAKTIDRIIDVFPPTQQNQIRSQLATVLEGVVSQMLIPKKDGKGVIPASEILIANSAVRNLIREGKPYQIQSIIQTGSALGMCTMESSINKLYQDGFIAHDEMMGRVSMEKQIYQTGR